MSDADRSFVTVMSRVLGPKGMAAYADLLKDPVIDPTGEAFDKLPADADEQTRADLAERMVSFVQSLYRQHPGLSTLPADAPRGEKFAMKTAGKALQDIYNDAQVDVLRRLGILLAEAQQAEVSGRVRAEHRR
jgi:hypothetical protein